MPFVFGRVGRAILPAIVVVLLWYGLAWAVWSLRGLPFPTPWMTAVRLVSLFGGVELSQASLYRHLGDSLRRWTLGFSLAALGGIVVGLVAGHWRFPQHVISPLLYGLQLVPGLAWIPVMLLLFGVGESATVAMIAITALAPIGVNVMDGVKRVDTTYVRAARMLGADRWQLFLYVLLPGSLPSIITGLRVGLGQGWRVLVAAEMVVGTGTGLGYSIIEARWTLDYTSAFACIVVICGVGLLVEHLLFSRLEQRTLQRWMLRKDEL